MLFHTTTKSYLLLCCVVLYTNHHHQLQHFVVLGCVIYKPPPPSPTICCVVLFALHPPTTKSHPPTLPSLTASHLDRRTQARGNDNASGSVFVNLVCFPILKFLLKHILKSLIFHGEIQPYVYKENMYFTVSITLHASRLKFFNIKKANLPEALRVG